MLLSLLIHFFSDRSLGTFFRRFRFRFRFFFCFRDYVIPFPFPDSGFHVLVLPHIVGKKDNYKYLVTLYTPYFRERFTFSVFFLSCKSLWAIYDMNLKFSFCVNTITWKAKKNQ